MLIIIITVLSVLLAITFFTIAERKLLASIQKRKGPNVTRFWGILQSFADGLKLLLKEIIEPVRSDWVLFLWASRVSLTTALSTWAFKTLAYMHYVTNFDFRLLFIYTASLLGVYAIIGAVLTSNPKYIPLRGLSFATRLISCVVSTALLLLPATACSSFFNLVAIVPQQRAWLVVPLFLVSFAFFILVFAATNPAFFDLPEAGPKIVADWGVECASMTLAMFFRATYTKG